MKTCERCQLPIRKKREHGWLICPLEPRSGIGTNEPLQGAWSRARSTELNSHSKDVLQPFNKDGQINKHFVQAHGTKALEKQTKLSERAIRENADKYG